MLSSLFSLSIANWKKSSQLRFFSTRPECNQSLSEKWTSYNSTKALVLLEGLSHWMLNLRPIIWKIFHKKRIELGREKSLILKPSKLWKIYGEWIMKEVIGSAARERVFVWFLLDIPALYTMQCNRVNHKWFRNPSEQRRNTIEISFNFVEPWHMSIFHFPSS